MVVCKIQLVYIISYISITYMHTRLTHTDFYTKENCNYPIHLAKEKFH